MINWQNIRLEADVADALEAYRAKLDYCVRRTPRRYPVWMRGKRVSLGTAVRFLLRSANAHHMRLLKMRGRKPLENPPTAEGNGETCSMELLSSGLVSPLSETDVASGLGQ